MVRRIIHLLSPIRTDRPHSWGLHDLIHVCPVRSPRAEIDATMAYAEAESPMAIAIGTTTHFLLAGPVKLPLLVSGMPLLESVCL
jgi:hypothetical protein